MSGAWFSAAGAAVVFAAATGAALRMAARVCAGLVPFPDGPAPGKPATLALVLGAGASGAVIAARGADLVTIGLAALVVAVLAACAASDIRCGLVPDVFTLVPLVCVLALALVAHRLGPFAAAAVVTAPFAGAAFASRGRAMGWGDVKLVALGGAVLPLALSLPALAAACLVAVATAVVRRRGAGPIAFAPYLCGGIAVAFVFSTGSP